MGLTSPTFVIAGAARGGTTALAESLRRHPDVFLTTPKEPHYLAMAGRPAAYTGPDDDTTINRVAVTEESAFLALFEGDDSLARGEGSVSTLYYHQEAVPRLLALNPDVRVVLTLREPVARAFSSYQYLQNRGSETEPDFLRAVSLEESRREAGWHHLWHYTGMSRYAEGVAHLLEAFGPDQVGVWWYDDLTSDEARVLTEIQDFIGVQPLAPEAIVRERVNSSGTPRRAWVQTAMQTTAKNPMLRTVGKKLVPFEVRERIRRGNLVSNDVPPEVRRALAPQFEADLGRLQEALGRPVPAAWRAPIR